MQSAPETLTLDAGPVPARRLHPATAAIVAQELALALAELAED